MSGYVVPTLSDVISAVWHIHEDLGPMNAVEWVIGLIVAAAVLATLARKIGVPYPVLLVLGGLMVGFVCGLTETQLIEMSTHIRVKTGLAPCPCVVVP